MAIFNSFLYVYQRVFHVNPWYKWLISPVSQAQKLPERAVKKGEARVLWHILKKHRRCVPKWQSFRMG